MKLRNLLFGTMIACAFVACSSDDDPNPTPNPTPEGDGVAEVMVNPDLLKGNIDSKALTKAAVDESVYDNYIVYVFNRATGANIGHGKPGTAFKVTQNPGAVDIMVVGNITSRASLTGEETKAVLLGKSVAFTDAEEHGETVNDSSNSTETTSQNSSIYPFTLQNEVINKIGYPSASNGEVLLTSTPIKVYRNVAKIVLNNIKVQNKPVTVGGDTYVYANPKVNVKRVFILNAQNSTKIAAVDTWGSVFKEGVVMGAVSLADYNKWVEAARQAKEGDPTNIKPYVPVEKNEEESEYVPHTSYGSNAANILGEISYEAAAGKTFNANNTFYVYESTNVASNPTLLVVEADFLYTDPLDPEKTITDAGYYTVELGKKGLDGIDGLGADFPGASAFMGVRRNIQYKINLSILAPGSDNPLYPNPKVASVNAQIELVGYGEVSSTTEFE